MDHRTERSMDHWWGPRVSLYLREEDYSDELRDDIQHMLGMQLPYTVRGFSTHMRAENVATGSVYMQATRERPINHMCFVGTVAQFMQRYLGINALDHVLSPGEWLALPEQQLRTIRSGGIWHDGTGALTRLRTLLHSVSGPYLALSVARAVAPNRAGGSARDGRTPGA